MNLQDQQNFIKTISSPSEVLAVVERGQALMNEAGDSPLLQGIALATVQMDLEDLEGEETASTIMENMWPNVVVEVEPIQIAA